LRSIYPGPPVVQIVIHCGLCGYQPGVILTLDAPPNSDEELRRLIAEQVGASMRCDRCHSELLPGTGTLAVEAEPPRIALARKAERMRRKMKGVRFAVGEPNGSCHGSVWRLWVNGNDVYIAARAITSAQKVSLHASGDWRVAFTNPYMSRASRLVPAGRGRIIDRWPRPPEFAPGWTRGFVIRVPASEVVPSVPLVDDPSDIVWLNRLPDGWCTHVTVLLSASDATGSGGRGFATAAGRENFTEVVTKLTLRDGSHVWVVAHAEEMTQSQQAQVEELRERTQAGGAVAIGKARKDSQADLRGFAGGYDDDGTRFFLDLALPDTSKAHC
jgi:hypothetical protein